MPTTVDELITKFTLDARPYQQGADAVVHATDRASMAIGRLAGGVMGGLNRAFRSLTSPIAGLIGIAGVGGLIGLIEHSVKTATSFDFMTRSLTAVTGSAQRAAEVLKFVDRLSIPSIFTSQELAEGAVRLEAFKLKTEEFLPIAERLGTLFGGTAQDVMEYVDALGRLKGGESGRALMVFKRAGISEQDLQAKGIRFSGSRELLSSAEQTLGAIEQIVKERFGRLGKEMRDSPMAKFASVMDALGRAARTAGFAFLEVLMPAAEKVGNFIQNLVDSGVLKSAVEGLTNLFSGKDLGDGLIRALATVVVLMQHLPEYVQRFYKYAQGAFDNLHRTTATFAGVLAAVFLYGPIVKGIISMIELFTTLRKVIQGVGVAAMVSEAIATGGASIITAAAAAAAALLAGAAVTAALDKMLPTLKSLGDIPGISSFSGQVDALVKQLSGPSALTPPDMDEGSSDGKGAPVLQQIAANTAATAKNTEIQKSLQRMILGGGELGKLGITPVEMGGIKRSGSMSRIQQAIEHLLDEFGREMIAVHSESSMRRARMLS